MNSRLIPVCRQTSQPNLMTAQDAAGFHFVFPEDEPLAEMKRRTFPVGALRDFHVRGTRLAAKVARPDEPEDQTKGENEQAQSATDW